MSGGDAVSSGEATKMSDETMTAVAEATPTDVGATETPAPSAEPTVMVESEVAPATLAAAETQNPEVEAVAEEGTPPSATVAEGAGEAEAEVDDVPTAMGIDERTGQPDGAQSDDSVDEEGGKPQVRLLSVGQAVVGAVKRISEFGAFVDIGVGRDGLVHISELSPRRIAKVTDVLQEGMEATFWIKKLDRDRNRISLTMIEPGVKTIRNMEKDDIVQGTVTRIMPYGAFVDIGIGRDALLHVREMGERYIAKPEDVVQVGEVIEARIIDISRRRARVDLSVKGLRPEPEPEPEPEREREPSRGRASAPPQPEPEEEQVDNFADMEVLSPFAAALRRAEESSGVKLNVRKQAKRNKKVERELHEEIFERTLSGVKS